MASNRRLTARSFKPKCRLRTSARHGSPGVAIAGADWPRNCAASHASSKLSLARDVETLPSISRSWPNAVPITASAAIGGPPAPIGKGPKSNVAAIGFNRAATNCVLPMARE